MKLHILNDVAAVACNENAPVNVWRWTFDITKVECTRCLKIVAMETKKERERHHDFLIKIHRRLLDLGHTLGPGYPKK